MGAKEIRLRREKHADELIARQSSGAFAGPELPAIWHLFGDEGLSQRLLVLAKMIERVASRKLQDGFGISVAQWRVLAFVCMSGRATASLIGESAEVDPAEVSRAVRTLVERELITREFEPGNRKTMVIVPTAQGRGLFGEIRSERQDYFSRITQRLSPSRKMSLGRALTQIAEEVVAERAEPKRRSYRHSDRSPGSIAEA